MSDALGRYYTENLFSNLLVQQLDCITPKTVLEFGVGNGSILNAVRSEWDKVKYYGFDVDKQIVNKYDKEKVILKYGDVLDESESKLNISFGKFDIAVCNPPYSRLKNENGEYNHLIQSLNFIPGSFPLTKDIVFLLKNLAYLKPNGKLGIIVPDTLITSHTYLNFRKQLLSNYEVEKIIELPSKIFRKTEAKTHILIVKNSKPTKKLVKLLFANKDGIIANENTIAKKALADRWDFSFNSRKSDVNYNSIELSKIATIKRGSFTHKSLKNLNCQYIHSTSYKNLSKLSVKNILPKDQLDKTYAKTGDIVMTRVGTRSVGKVALITSGKVLVSDCILIIRVEKIYRDLVFSYLSSDDYSQWLKIHTHGVCAQLVSKMDLANFKINLI